MDMAKNSYEITGDTTILIVQSRKGSIFRVKIDTEDLPLVQAKKWWANFRRSNGKCYLMTSGGIYLHRFLMNAPRNMFVDHINEDALDNRKKNLRIVTRSGNRHNISKPNRNSRSGIRNVYPTKNGKWIAAITVNGKRHCGGTFEDIQLAEQAAKNLRARYAPYSPEARQALMMNAQQNETKAKVCSEGERLYGLDAIESRLRIARETVIAIQLLVMYMGRRLPTV